MRIGEIARQSGVRISAIRYYESVGLLDPARRNSGGRREFDERTLERLALISAARTLGLGVSEILKLLQGFTDPAKSGLRTWIAARIATIDADLERMQRARHTLARTLECACRDFDTCGKTCAWIETPARAPRFNARSLPGGGG